VLDLTKLTEAELDALDINGPQVRGWMEWYLNPNRDDFAEWSDDENRVFWHLLHRQEQQERQACEEAERMLNRIIENMRRPSRHW
jgi:hypothetical protein